MIAGHVVDVGSLDNLNNATGSFLVARTGIPDCPRVLIGVRSFLIQTGFHVKRFRTTSTARPPCRVVQEYRWKLGKRFKLSTIDGDLRAGFSPHSGRQPTPLFLIPPSSSGWPGLPGRDFDFPIVLSAVPRLGITCATAGVSTLDTPWLP